MLIAPCGRSAPFDKQPCECSGRHLTAARKETIPISGNRLITPRDGRFRICCGYPYNVGTFQDDGRATHVTRLAERRTQPPAGLALRIRQGLIASLLLAVAGSSTLATDANPGDGLMAEGRYEEAIAAYEREAGRLQTAESRAQLLAARERIADRLMRDARSARAAGQTDDAERNLRRLVQINPTDAAVRAELAQLQRQRDLDGKTGRAEELLRAGRPAAAESLAREVLLAGPDHARAQRLMQQVAAGAVPMEVVATHSSVGGGALPLVELASLALALQPPAVDAFAAHLRSAAVPLIVRIEDARILVDLRCVRDDEVALAAVALSAACAAS